MDPFTYERVKEFTGKLQYRTDRASAVSAAGRSVKRGEVIEITNEALARALVLSGNFAHVPADTPLGIPAPPTEAAPSAATTDTPPPLIEIETEV